MRNRRSRGPCSASHALVNVELRPNREIADRVHDEVQSVRVGAVRPAIEIVRRVDEQPAIVRRVVERLEHRRGVRAE